MCIRTLALVMCLIATAAQADPVGDALGGRNPRLVVLLVDGLVDEFVQGEGVDGAALMPATRQWTDRALRCTDVLAAETNAVLARELLRRAADERAPDQVEWVREERPETRQAGGAIEAFAEREGGQVLVLDLGWLEPRLQPDPETLARLDPAPWEAGTAPTVIEAHRSARQRRTARLVKLDGRASRNNDSFTRDLRWVVSASHASIDARLRELLDAATATGAAVLLTATSSCGLGQREAVGPGVGTALDVARVPLYLHVPRGRPGVDEAPRQWIELDPGWFRQGVDGDRLTWAVPKVGVGEAKAVCEVRWTTPEFTLLDTAAPRMPPRLFDRLLDPGEWYDRAVEYPALADSLRGVLRDRLYGEEPVIVLRAGDEPVDLILSSPAPIEVSTGRPEVHLGPGESVRVRMPLGAENLQLGGFQAVSIGGEPYLLTELVVHSAAWRALAREPVERPEMTVWME